VNERERRQRVWELTCAGIKLPALAHILGVSSETVRRDIRVNTVFLFKFFSYGVGDWVEIDDAPLYCGKIGVVTELRPSERVVSVDLDPLRRRGKGPREQLFRAEVARKLNPLEVLAKAAV